MDLVLILALLGATFLLVRWGVRHLDARLARQQAEIRALAARRGWQVVPSLRAGDIYRLRGATNGAPWEVAAEGSGSSSHTSVGTRWHSEVVRHADLVVMVRTRAGWETMESLWGRAASGVLGAMVATIGMPAPQHAQLAREGRRLPGRAPGFDDAYVAVARPGAGFDDLITPAVEQALLAWAALPLSARERDSLCVDVGQTNLRVYCTGALDAAALERLVHVGEAMAAGITARR